MSHPKQIRRRGTLFVCQAGLIAALYTVLTVFVGAFGLAGGAIQLRISEALFDRMLPFQSRHGVHLAGYPLRLSRYAHRCGRCAALPQAPGACAAPYGACQYADHPARSRLRIRRGGRDRLSLFERGTRGDPVGISLRSDVVFGSSPLSKTPVSRDLKPKKTKKSVKKSPKKPEKSRKKREKTLKNAIFLLFWCVLNKNTGANL